MLRPPRKVGGPAQVDASERPINDITIQVCHADEVHDPIQGPRLLGEVTMQSEVAVK
jgi:hypothetical protein